MVLGLRAASLRAATRAFAAPRCTCARPASTLPRWPSPAPQQPAAWGLGGALRQHRPPPLATPWLRGLAKQALRQNEQIEAEELRVVGIQGEELGVVSLDEALELARQAGVDLVEVNPKAEPPICRLRDTAAMEKKAAAMERKAVKRSRTEKGQAKKVRLSPRTDDGSVLVKAAQIAKMLRKGQTVHVFVWAKNAKDRVEQHETAMPLLGRVFDAVAAECEEDGCCWYREEPGYRCPTPFAKPATPARAPPAAPSIAGLADVGACACVSGAAATSTR